MEANDHRIENDVVGNILQGMSAQTAGNDQQTTVPKDKAVCNRKSSQNLEKKSEKRPRRDADQNKDGGHHEPVGTSSKQPSDKGKGDGRNHKRPSTKHRNEGSKVNEGASTSSRPEEPEGASTKKQLAEITQQLTALTNAMKFVTPIVTELKAARDEYMEYEAASEEGEYPDSDAEQEPPVKKVRSNSQDDTLAINLLEQESPSILNTMAKAVNQSEKTGPEIDDKLSEVVTQYLERGMDRDSLEKIQEKILRPQNCERLKVVRVNPPIFNNVSKDTKQEDLCLQKVQRPLISGITNLVALLNQMLTAAKNKVESPSNATLMTTISQTIGILCDSSHELDLRRRWLFKSEMKEEYKALCSESNPVKGELFGDQLSQSVKDLNETNKVTSRLTKKKQSHRHTPTSYPFLYGGHRHRFKPRNSHYSRPFNRSNSSRGRPHHSQNKSQTQMKK